MVNDTMETLSTLVVLSEWILQSHFHCYEDAPYLLKMSFIVIYSISSLIQADHLYVTYIQVNLKSPRCLSHIYIQVDSNVIKNF